MLRRRTTACVTLLLLAATTAWAGPEEDFFATPTLMAHVKAGRVQAAEEMLFTRAFDARTLGRALLEALTVNDPTREGERTAFRLANLLMAKGADPDFADIAGKTPLMEAAGKRFETVVHLLVDAGADLTARDDEGRDAFDYAALPGSDAQTVTWLLEAGLRNRATASNVRISVREGKVEILYDLEAERPVGVALRCVGSSGGRSVVVRSVTGDVGQGVVPGKDRRAVWAVLDDHPQGFGDATVSLEVVVLTGR